MLIKNFIRLDTFIYFLYQPFNLNNFGANLDRISTKVHQTNALSLITSLVSNRYLYRYFG